MGQTCLELLSGQAQETLQHVRVKELEGQLKSESSLLYLNYLRRFKYTKQSKVW